MSYNKSKKKKRKFRKNSNHEIKLAQEDLDFLVEKTKFNAAEISEWHSGFVEDNPGGTLNKSKMMDMYSSVLSIAKATMFVNQIFEKFDTDNDGSIDFKVTMKGSLSVGGEMRGFAVQEFMLATNVSESEEAAEEKLRWAFRLYDKDSSGTIDCKEMMDIVGNLYEMEGFSKDTANEKAASVFRMLDRNDDGELNEDEFVRGCLRDERLRSLLNSGSNTSK